MLNYMKIRKMKVAYTQTNPTKVKLNIPDWFC